MACYYAKESTVQLDMALVRSCCNRTKLAVTTGAATSYATQQGSTLWRPLLPCEKGASWVFTQRMSRHPVPSGLPNPCCATPISHYSNGTHGAISSDSLLWMAASMPTTTLSKNKLECRHRSYDMRLPIQFPLMLPHQEKRCIWSTISTFSKNIKSNWLRVYGTYVQP